MSMQLPGITYVFTFFSQQLQKPIGWKINPAPVAISVTANNAPQEFHTIRKVAQFYNLLLSAELGASYSSDIACHPFPGRHCYMCVILLLVRFFRF
jgi:hypothetical protein